MELDSVRNLKLELRDTAVKFGHGILGGFLDVSLGIGLGPTAKDFKLAVRLRGVGPLHFMFKSRVESLVGAAELDIMTTGPVRVISGCGTRSVPLAKLGIGASIGFKGALGGTLGFFAKRRGDKKLGIVSNNHVIAATDRGTEGAEVQHPSFCDGNSVTVARLSEGFPPLHSRGFRQVDCAFAVLEKAVADNLPQSALSSLGQDGSLRRDTALPQDSMIVRKIGRTTGRREGKIRAFDFDRLVVHKYHFGKAKFENQIEIESTEARPFSNPGDSGAVVYNADRQPIGLLFAETDRNSDVRFGLNYANRIDAVLESLGVDIEV
jgi:hypothetical protein